MKKNLFRVIGVMSGTSLDGIDLVFVEFKYERGWHFKIYHAQTIKYPTSWYQTLKNLVAVSKASLEEIDAEYSLFLAETIQRFVNKYKIQNIDAICSHGHTAQHKPENKVTYQIGNLPILAQKLGHTVVCDFRVQDVALGGQGAPLVPIGDLLLFSEYDFCLNLGGFANVSLSEGKQRIAYDICPVNVVLNHYANLLGLDYDPGGRMASTGTINRRLLESLNKLEFYNADFPKSLGIEWVNKNIFPLIESYNIPPKMVLRTFVEHISEQIARALHTKENATVLMTGGGVYNSFLIDRLKQRTSNTIHMPNADLIEFKEAVIFGFLGVLKLRNEVNCLKSVTGAKKNHSSGKIFTPENGKF